MGGRVLKPVSVSLLTRGRALDLHASTGGSVPLELHLGGTVDEDRRGIEMETFALRYPEATWTMEEPAHLRFPANELVLEPVRLVAPGEAIRLGGSKRGDKVDATLGLETLDLATLPRALLPPSMVLAGRVTLDARARGTLQDPAVAATVDAVDVTVGKVQHLFVKGNGEWAARRARAKLDARGLGTELTADVDLPVDALRRRKHDPVRARISMPTFDVAQVVCAAVRTKLLARGCDDDRSEVTGTAELELDLSGHADAPVLQATARTHGLRYRKLPPTDLTLAVSGPERGDLSASAKGTALLGSIDVEGSVGRSLAQLVSDAHPGASARVRRAARPRPHRGRPAQAAARCRARPGRAGRNGRARRRPGRHGRRAHRRAHAQGAEVPDTADGPHRGHGRCEGPSNHRRVARGARRPRGAGQRHGGRGRLTDQPPDAQDLRRRPLPAGRQVRPSGARAAAGGGGRGPAGPAPPRDGRRQRRGTGHAAGAGAHCPGAVRQSRGR